MKSVKTPALLVCLLFFSISVIAQKTSLSYTVKMDDPGLHFFHVQFSCNGVKKDFIDFKIRQLTKNKKSLDDVMRFLYKEYYQKKKRGFTEEELRNAFETVAGSSLAREFEYVTTTKELNYPMYFNYAGLNIDIINNETKDIEVILGKKSEKAFKITAAGNPDLLQKQILEDWLKG